MSYFIRSVQKSFWNKTKNGINSNLPNIILKIIIILVPQCSGANDSSAHSFPNAAPIFPIELTVPVIAMVVLCSIAPIENAERAIVTK